ncbi:MAG: Ldh family oxidoreductase [Alphaproteobacteria bacterium]
MLNHRTLTVKIDVLRDFMERLLQAVGVDVATSRTLAGIHLESDLRGVSVQGFNHLISSHLNYYRNGHAEPTAKPTVGQNGPSHALIDGNDGPGPLAMLLAVDTAIAKARSSGIGIVAVTNSHDSFHAGLYVEKVAQAGLISMMFSDDTVLVVHPHGGVEPNIGSNPMAWAVPTRSDPFVIDFTPCATLPTYVRYTQRYEGALEPGVAHDADGNLTIDPFAVANGKGYQADIGAIDPGGHRGFGMLMMIDFLSGAFANADMGLAHVTKLGAVKGHMLMAFDPGLFGNSGFRDQVQARIDELKASKTAPGIDAIRVPGEGSAARRRASLVAGEVTIDEILWRDGLKVGLELGVQPRE